MSYRHGLIDQQLAVAITTSSALDPMTGARWNPGYTPIKVRAVWAIVTTATTAANNIITFKYRPVAGTAANEVTIGTITLPTGALAGKVYYKEVDGVKIPPGAEIVAQTDGGGDAGAATVGITYEPWWENPANNANMIASA